MDMGMTDPNAMDPMSDPSMMGGDPNAMATDPNAAAGMDPMVGGGDPSMGGAEMPEDPEMSGEEGGDSTMDMFSQLSDDDKEAARAYIRSMLNRDKTQSDEEEMPDDSTEIAPSDQSASIEAPVQPQGGVMMEMTKGRLKKVQRYLNENFPIDGDDKDNKKIIKKTPKDKKRSYGNPFSSPRK